MRLAHPPARASLAAQRERASYGAGEAVAPWGAVAHGWALSAPLLQETARRSRQRVERAPSLCLLRHACLVYPGLPGYRQIRVADQGPSGPRDAAPRMPPLLPASPPPRLPASPGAPAPGLPPPLHPPLRSLPPLRPGPDHGPARRAPSPAPALRPRPRHRVSHVPRLCHVPSSS